LRKNKIFIGEEECYIEVESGTLGCSIFGFPIVITWTFFLVTVGSRWNT